MLLLFLNVYAQTVLLGIYVWLKSKMASIPVKKYIDIHSIFNDIPWYAYTCDFKHTWSQTKKHKYGSDLKEYVLYLSCETYLTITCKHQQCKSIKNQLIVGSYKR